MNICVQYSVIVCLEVKSTNDFSWNVIVCVLEKFCGNPPQVFNLHV